MHDITVNSDQFLHKPGRTPGLLRSTMSLVPVALPLLSVPWTPLNTYPRYNYTVASVIQAVQNLQTPYRASSSGQRKQKMTSISSQCPLYEHCVPAARAPQIENMLKPVDWSMSMGKSMKMYANLADPSVSWYSADSSNRIGTIQYHVRLKLQLIQCKPSTI
jgi:hypothetical protein